MTLVTGTVQDLGYDGMEGTLWARPARFRSDGQVVYAPERKPYKITGGVVSAELAPGPAVLELQVGSHARGTFEVVIPDTDITLAELLDTVFAWEPAQVSLFVAEREAAEAAKRDAEQAATLAGTAKADAETAAQQTGQDRAHVDSIRETLDEAAQNNVAPYLTQTELNATYGTKAEVEGKLDKDEAATTYAPLDAARAQATLTLPAVFDRPAGFTMSIPFRATRDAHGTYGTDLPAPETFHTRGAGPTLYIDPIDGNNSNDGLTWGTALRSPSYAANRNDNEAAELICKGGFYNRTDSPAIRRADLILRAAPGEQVIFSACDPVAPSAWVVWNNIYKTPLPTVNGVLDRSAIDAFGDPLELTQITTSAADVRATPNSWYVSGGEVYVHLRDGRAPDGDVLVSRSVNSLPRLDVTDLQSSYYLEGITWWGGTTANFTTTAPGSKLVAKDCGFKFAGSTNGLSVNGFQTVIMDTCEASRNRYDGFNYHANAGLNGEVIEINCLARGNGKVPGSQNGSSAHEAYKIARIGGAHFDSLGANVADVGETLSWNVGVRAGGSKDVAGGYGVDFYGANMWLDSCVATSPLSTKLDPTAPDGEPVLRVRNSVLMGTTVGATDW